MRLIFILLTLALSRVSFGFNLNESFQSRKWTEYGVRPLAMGNAFVAIADDENAFYYNPAGLAYQKKSYSFVPFELQSSTKIFTNLVEYMSAVGDNDDSTNALLDLLDDNIGEVNNIEFRYTPWYYSGLWGVSPMIKKYAGAIVHRQPSLELTTGLDVSVPVTLAYKFFGDLLALGASANFKWTQNVEEFISPEDLDEFADGEPQGLDDYEKSGFAVGGDLGLIVRKSLEKHHCSMGLSWKNIGDMDYYKSGDRLKPNREKASVNLGLAYKFLSENFGQYQFSLDGHSLNQNFSVSKKIHFGFGVLLREAYEILLGFHQGYVTAGIKIAAGIFTVVLSTWAEEYGEVAGDDPDRRVGFKYVYYF